MIISHALVSDESIMLNIFDQQSILGVAGRPSLDRWASCGSLGSVLSSASINYLMEEDLGDNVVRFR